MAPLIVAIDAGTTAIKALCVDENARVRGGAASELSQSYPRPGWVEHDADEIWRVTGSVTRRALEDAGAGPGDIAGIGITNQRETTVLWDRSSGQPVAPAIVWQCRRSAGICERLLGDGLGDELRRRTGLIVDPYFSATKIMWHLENTSGLRRRAEAGEIAFGTIDSWLLWKLTGGDVHATEPSNASRTLLYSLEQAAWDPWILDALDIPAPLLPDIKASSGWFGDTTELGSRALPVAGVAGDQQAALFGQTCFRAGMAKNTYGTGSFLLSNTGRQAVVSEHGLLTTAAWDTGSGPRYALEGSIFSTGAAIQWLRDGLEVIGEAGETEGLAASVDDAGGTFLVPAFSGLGAPHWDPYARGAYLGITQSTTKAHLARAAVEAMAFQTRDVVEAMRAGAARDPIELRVDGGASVMDLLCQFQADQLGIEVLRPANRETTALGAAYLAGLALDMWSEDDLAARWEPEAVFEPAADRARADELYEGWKRALARAGDWIGHG